MKPLKILKKLIKAQITKSYQSGAGVQSRFKYWSVEIPLWLTFCGGTVQNVHLEQQNGISP